MEINYKVFIDKPNGILLENGNTFDSLKELTKKLKEKYSPYSVRSEKFGCFPYCWAFFVKSN